MLFDIAWKTNRAMFEHDLGYEDVSTTMTPLRRDSIFETFLL